MSVAKSMNFRCLQDFLNYLVAMPVGNATRLKRWAAEAAITAMH